MSVKVNYTKHNVKRQFENAEPNELCVCPICERVGKKIKRFVQPANGKFDYKIVHKEVKRAAWQNVELDICSPATDFHGNLITKAQ